MGWNTLHRTAHLAVVSHCVGRAPFLTRPIAVFARLISLKVLLGTVLSTFAIQRQTGMASREQADQVNSFGRKRIAENTQEEVSYIGSPVVTSYTDHSVAIAGL